MAFEKDASSHNPSGVGKPQVVRGNKERAPIQPEVCVLAGFFSVHPRDIRVILYWGLFLGEWRIKLKLLSSRGYVVQAELLEKPCEAVCCHCHLACLILNPKPYLHP